MRAVRDTDDAFAFWHKGGHSCDTEPPTCERVHRLTGAREPARRMRRRRRRIIGIVADDLGALGDVARSWTVSINFFQNDLREDNLPKLAASDAVTRARRFGLKLNCEVLEAGIMLRTDKQAALSHLRALGFTVSIDDFGVGFSNLAEVLRMAPDCLKIDKQFIRDLLINEEDTRIANTIIDLGKSLNLTVVAEGVETAEQEYYLSQRGCALAQGYFFSKPLLPRDFENFVQTFHARIVENNA